MSSNEDSNNSLAILPLNLSTKLMSAGIVACVADAITFPLDVCKVRLQIQGEVTSASTQTLKYRGIISTIIKITNEEGFKALYGGLNAGLTRQMGFSSVRIGCYETVRDFYKRIANVNDGFGMLFARICAGLTTGAAAVVLAHPADVVKIRLQANPAAYGGCLEAYREIFRTEGIKGLWKGTVPNIMRTAVINICEVVTYDSIKTALIEHNILNDNIFCHITGATGSGLVATVIGSPVDVVKTRYMNSRKGTYSSVVNCAATMLRTNGAMSFYKGVWPSFIRLTSWNVLMFVSYEEVLHLIMKIAPKDSIY